MTPKIMDILQDIFQNNNNKSIILQLRNEELRNALINATSFLINNPSISERAYCYQQGITEQPVCPYCGKPLRFRKMNKGYFKTCGDNECKGKGIAKGVSKHDFVEIQKKMRATYKARTGYEHNMQNPEFMKEFFDKRERETGERYAVCSERAKAARKDTFLEKYGTTNFREVVNHPDVQAKAIEKYGSLENMYHIAATNAGKTRKQKDLDILISKLSEMGYDFVDSFIKDGITEYFHIKCKRCNKIFEISRQAANIYYRSNHFNICPKCDYKDMTYRSNFEKSVVDYIIDLLKESNYTILTNKRIHNLEYDIVIPELKIAVECNGLYWHSELYKDKKWHLYKKEIIEAEGYTLIQVWEDDWYYRQDIVKSRLAAKLGVIQHKIFARKCTIKQFKSKAVKSFLESNHIQGSINAAYNYGLMYNGELVQLICIGKSRKAISKNKDIAEYELLRMVTKQNYVVVGGFSKLIAHFKEQYNNAKIFSFVDLSWSNLKGTGYINAGWSLLEQTDIDYWWIKKGDKKPLRENRINYQKHKLIQSDEDKSKTERELMNERGYYRVFGLGNLIMTI